jgi:hypothetical protein
MKIVSGSIDLNKLDKSKIKEHANGAKYYPVLIMLNDEADKYGNDCSIATGQTKEEREAKQKKSFIGNAKTVWSSDGKQQPKSLVPDQSDDLGF